MKSKTFKLNKGASIDDLIVTVAKGFDGVNDEMRRHFNEMEEKFDKVDSRLHLITTKLDRALYSEIV
ncbi:MAG: hypothetical protein WC621_05480 [Patescibacteria group bacterium]